MDNPDELKLALADFYGTDQLFYHSLNRTMNYTDGVQMFAQNAGGGAYWFLDIVATELMAIHKREPFLCIRLVVPDASEPSMKAVILADDGNDNALFKREIDYTDCPPGEWKFYLTGNVMMLPSEY